MGKWKKGFGFWLAVVLVCNLLLDPLVDCQRAVFAAEGDEEDLVIQIHDFEVETVRDQDNYLNGSIRANVTYNASESAMATATLYYLDSAGYESASYEEEIELQPGDNEIRIEFGGVEWIDIGMGEEVELSYRLEIIDTNGNYGELEQGSVVIPPLSTEEPEGTPSEQPENTPSELPENTPSEQPDDTFTPEESPTVQPEEPSTPPTLLPSMTPGASPTVQPSTSPAINVIEDEDLKMGATEITVNKDKLEMGVGEKFQLKASVVSEDDVEDELNFFTYDYNKLTVTKRGKVTAQNTGRASVIVEASNGFVKVVWVTVKNAPKKVTLNAKTKRLKKGKTFQIKATVPKKSANNTFTYTSSRKSIAKVTKKGKVKARKKGRTVITVKTYNGKKAKMTIVVV